MSTLQKQHIEAIKLKLATFYRANKVEFDADGHTYKINGSFFTGVTTITDVRSKAFLAPWAAKESYLYLKENWDIAKTYTDELKEELLLAAKTAWTRKGNKAKDSGSLAHDWIDKYIKNGKSFEETTFSEQDYPDDKEAKSAIKAFLVWEGQRKPIWVVNEEIVVSLKNKYAGMIDCLCYLDDKLTLLDFKTSKQVSDSFLLQLAGYEIALEEMGIHVQNRVILRLPKDGKPAEELPVSDDPEVRLFCEEAFLHCRQIHRFNIFIDNKMKEENGKINMEGKTKKGDN